MRLWEPTEDPLRETRGASASRAIFMDTKVILTLSAFSVYYFPISRRSELLFVFDRSARRGRSPCIAYFLCKSNVELIHIGERSTASRARVLQDARRPLAGGKKSLALFYRTAESRLEPD